MAQRLAKANPSSAEAKRDLIVSYFKLWRLTGEKDSWRKALEIAEKLNRDGQLAPRDAWIIDDFGRKANAGKEGVKTPE